MMTYPAQKRTVERKGVKYLVWDEYPFRDENPQVEPWDFWTVFANNAWEPGLEDVLGRYLNSKSTFIDVGAWIGPVSIIAARMCARVVAVEPDPVAHERLINNIGRQRRRNIIPIAAALTAADGPVSIGHRVDRQFGDSMTSTIFSGDAVEVDGRTLDSIIDAAGVDPATIGMIKMDIEGGEQTALPVCVDTIRRLNAPLLLAMHTAIVDDPDSYLTAVTQALDGFTTTLLSGLAGGLGTVIALPS